MLKIARLACLFSLFFLITTLIWMMLLFKKNLKKIMSKEKTLRKNYDIFQAISSNTDSLVYLVNLKGEP